MKHLIPAMLVVAFTAIAFGDNNVITKYPDPSYGSLDLTSSADVAPLDSSDYNARTVITVSDRKTLTICASFGTASANASIGVIWGTVDPKTGYFKPDPCAPGDWATFTADGTYTVNSRYVSRSAAFDTQNRKAGIVYVRSISAGNVLVGWSLH